MLYIDKTRKYKEGLNRREFLWLASLSTAGLVMGCAADPVTGKNQLMLVSKNQEIELDKKNSPHQISVDYGLTQDKKLNAYLNRTGKQVASKTHRPDMPYSFNAVNATYVNAYAFPGGTIAATRGILLKLDNEAELAALLGHELGHVNARHAAEQMSKGVLTQAMVAGASVYMGIKNPKYSELTAALGMIGAGALLSSYSRDNEREADALGMEYMVRAGYGPEGMVGLMDILKGLNKKKPSAVELLFATHPMSDERYNTSVKSARTKYASARDQTLHKERYMDYTADLRAIKGAVYKMQKGESAMALKKYGQAESHFKSALKKVPHDYACLLMTSKSLIAQNKKSEALRYSQKAKHINPGEAQALHLSGFTKISMNAFDEAYEDFRVYEKLLPGNPNTIFFKGLALEGRKHYKSSAKEYRRYLNIVNQGKNAQHAHKRLKEWGYIN